MHSVCLRGEELCLRLCGYHSPQATGERSRLRQKERHLPWFHHTLSASSGVGWLTPAQSATAVLCRCMCNPSSAREQSLLGLILPLPLSWILRQCHRPSPCPGGGAVPYPEQALGCLTHDHPMQFSLSEIPSGDTRLRDPLHKQQSLPLRPIIPLVARISDQNASGAPPMTVREKTRLEKFRQLLSSHNTDLGEFPGALGK